MDSSSCDDDDDEVQQAKEQFIELLRQADEMGATDVITKLGIHWFDGLDTEQDNRRTVRPDWIIDDINKAYATVHLTISLMKEKSARQDTNPTKLIQQAHAIQISVEKITQDALFGETDPMIVSWWGIQVVPEFPQRLCHIVFTFTRFMLEQLKKEQH